MNHVVPHIGIELSACLYRDFLHRRDRKDASASEDDDSDNDDDSDDDDDEQKKRYASSEDRERIRNLIFEFGTEEAVRHVRFADQRRRDEDEDDDDEDDDDDDDDDADCRDVIKRKEKLEAAKRKVAELLGLEIQDEKYQF